MTTKRSTLTSKDVAEITVGSLALAYPVATTEEVWNLSKELSLLRVLLLAFGFLMALSAFVYTVYRHEGLIPKRRDFYSRVAATYTATLLTCALILLAIDRLDFVGDSLVAIKRTVLVAFPASFAATVVDSMG